MAHDFEMLTRIARKWSEPLTDDIAPEKTIGEWRKELAALLTEVMFYVADRTRGHPGARDDVKMKTGGQGK